MKIIAHRGAGMERPPNSLAAFERALAIGVDAIEADLLLSKDGYLVVRHDDLIQIDGTWRFITEMTLDELQQIDLGGGERMPSLDQFLERFSGRCLLVLDIKTHGIARPLAVRLQQGASQGPLHVTSFLHTEIAELTQLLPSVECSIVLACTPISVEALFRDTQTRQVSLFRSYLREAAVRRLREVRITVWAYPVNLPREAERFAVWGVDAIYTDDPAAMQGLRR